jgi:hypothetical protein
VAGADWQAHTLQLALFTQRALQLNTDIFAAFSGSVPESQDDRPKQGIRIQSGQFDDAHLRVTITPIRVDIVLGPSPELSMGGAQLTTGELKAELGKFAKPCLEWLPKWEVPTTRLALIVRAVAWATTTIEAYEILARNLTSVRVRPGEMSDLIYRVNWRANTKTLSEGFYNRVTTWSAQKLALSGMLTPGQEIQLDSKEFAQVEMDLNTPAERTAPLPVDRFTTIFKDLHQLAMEIADVGECP